MFVAGAVVDVAGHRFLVRAESLRPGFALLVWCSPWFTSFDAEVKGRDLA